MTLVALRRIRPNDVDLVHSWRTEPSIAVHQPLLPLTREQVREMILQRSHTPVGPQSSGEFQWLIVADDTPTGWISLKISPQDRPHAKGSIGYAISESHRRRGYAAAGVAALLPIAFGQDGFDLERLEAIAAVDNAASRRVLKSNGFQFEGIQRGLLLIHGTRIDHAMYGRLRSDPPDVAGEYV